MARKFRITVDGRTFDVTVEEVGGAGEAPLPAPAIPSLPPAPYRSEGAAGKGAAPSEKRSPEGATGGGGEEVVRAPLPGLVLEIKVQVGQQVRAGDVLCLLEAMKMENEVPSPVDGEVKAIHQKKGQAVMGGDPLVTVVPA
ncbi:MAG: biotin/lipoyl-binding protein [Bacillota bacterium]|nr:biotin/lipoyl-binding protein [Bacillota bacterium]